MLIPHPDRTFLVVVEGPRNPVRPGAFAEAIKANIEYYIRGGIASPIHIMTFGNQAALIFYEEPR